MELNDNVEREKIESQLNDNWKKAMKQLQSDIDQYGEDFNMLINNFPLPGRIVDAYSFEKRQDVLNKILMSYPESFMAARSVFNKMIEAISENDLEEVEKYYNNLLEIQRKKSEKLILGNGLEAVSQAGLNLAWMYLRADRIEDSEKMLRSLEENCPDAVYSIRSEYQGESILATSEDAFDRIRQAVTEIREYGRSEW